MAGSARGRGAPHSSVPPLGLAAAATAASTSAAGPSLLGDRSHSVIFDNSSVKALVPDFVCTTPFATGVRDIVNWYDANPDQQIVDDLDATFDRLIAAAQNPVTTLAHRPVGR